MIATHRVKDSNDRTIGFLVNEQFYTDYYVAREIELIDNLMITRDKRIREKKELPTISYADISKRFMSEFEAKNPFARDIQEELLKWKENPIHKVLQVEGSRQIGKTTELLKFAYKNYEYIIYVNLAADMHNFAETLTSHGINPITMERYCRNAALPHYVNNKNTILIIDEIQINPNVYNWIRTLHSDLDCDLIVTGSYLGQTLKKEYFQPAGTVTYIHMFPLSFREFCRVFNEEENLLSIDLYGSGDKEKYEILFKLYSVYKQIGGYPEVVKAFLKSKSITSCHAVIRDLLETFEKESRNYFSGSKESLIFKTVYTEALKEMCNEKKGTGKNLVETVTNIVKLSQKMLVSRDEISSAIQWLIYSGIIGECGLCNNGNIGEIIPARRLYFMDCGIASYLASQGATSADSVAGFITENFVYTELYRLYAMSFEQKEVRGDTPSFSIYHNWELDFMVLGKDGTVCGIEVKTDTGDPKSLKVFIEKGFIDKGIVAKKTQGGRGDKFDTIPAYTVGARFPYR